jgi:AraC-like DNA-binding protein
MALYSGLVLFHYTALDHKSYNSLRYYSPIDGLFLLMMAPCLYFYILSVLNKPTPFFKLNNLLHFLPFIPYVLFNIYFFTLPFEQRIAWLIRDFHTGTSEMIWLNVIIYSQIILYLSLCYRLVNTQLKITSIIEFENTQLDIAWLKVYLLINLSFILVTLPLCFFIGNEQTSINIGQVAMDIQFAYMFFKWTLHSDFSIGKKRIDQEIKSNTLKLNSDLADDQLAKLNTYMEEFKPYLNEACSIQTLSEQTGIPQYQLTSLLNYNMQKTFPEYINEYRIHTAKHMLLSIESGTKTIESIALECGFGSKSNFNRTFKRYTNNLTPTEFIRQHKHSTDFIDN